MHRSKRLFPQNVLEKELASQGISSEAYTTLSGALKSKFDTAVEKQMASDEILAILYAKTAEQTDSDTVKMLIHTKTEEQIQALVEQNMALAEVRAQISASIAQASSGAESFRTLKAQLYSYNSFYQGLISYIAGVASAANGAAQIDHSRP